MEITSCTFVSMQCCWSDRGTSAFRIDCSTVLDRIPNFVVTQAATTTSKSVRYVAQMLSVATQQFGNHLDEVRGVVWLASVLKREFSIPNQKKMLLSDDSALQPAAA